MFRLLCSGGRQGRGAAGKTPSVVAVSTGPEGQPRKLKLTSVKGYRERESGAKRWLAPGSQIVTEGLRLGPFKWVNTTLSSIKSAISGTHRKLGPHHAQRYFVSFAWQPNRRFQLQTMISHFVRSAARTQLSMAAGLCTRAAE